MNSIGSWVLFLFPLLISLNETYANDVTGCGGFVISSTKINYQPIKIKLYTNRGIIKYISDCAPNNGYYFIPLYDHGEYVLRIEPPEGWIFDPPEISFDFDGKNDLCSKQMDINFVFKGFSIFGKVFSQNSLVGPKGVEITLLSQANKNVIKKNSTTTNGFYSFHEVLPGQYIVEASRENWKFIRNQISLEVIDDNVNHREHQSSSNQLCLLGYAAFGKVLSDKEPISNVKFILFGQNSASSSLKFDCNKSQLPITFKLKTRPGYNYLCHVTSDDKGFFKFSSLPVGKYLLYPYYEAENIRFEVQPSEFEFDIVDDDFSFGITFEIGGFTVFGNVVNKLNSQIKIQNAVVELINQNSKSDVIKSFVDENGKFIINNLKTSTYLIKTYAENYQFDDIEFLISPNSPNIPVISPNKFEICGKILFKNFDYTFKNLELVVTKNNSEAEKKIFSLKDENFCLFLSNGHYNIELKSPYSSLKFWPKTLSLKVYKPKLDLIFEQRTAHIKGTIELKSSLIEDPEILTVIFSNEKNVLKILNFDELKYESGNQYEFNFDNVLPGEYSITMGGKQASLFCWESSTKTIVINENKMTNVNFKQKGFLIKIFFSHVSDLKIKTPNGKIDMFRRESISKEKFIEYCANEVGKYVFTPLGCHKFFKNNEENFIFDTETMAGQVITLTAVKHLIKAKFQTTFNISDLEVSISVKFNDQERNEKFFLESLEKNKSNSALNEYVLSLYEDSMAEIRIEPRSSQLIFKPLFFNFRLKDDCFDDKIIFTGKQGIFIDGQVSDGTENVSINVFDEENNELVQTTFTDKSGKYRVGPFDEDFKLKIEAFKEGFIFKEYPNRIGHFETEKLSSILITISNENQEPLSDVLISLSGGKNNFRKNSLIETNGKLKFNNLSPGQYFVRFFRKEYDFEPLSQMIELQSGNDFSVTVIGKKVAFSCIGSVSSLNGEPESGIVIEAVGIRNVVDNDLIQCSQLQEETTTENDGSFCILGLLPQCQYIIRFKTESLIQKNIQKSIPQVHSVRVQEGDLKDVKFIALFKNFKMDVSLTIQTDEDYLNTLFVELYDENESTPLFKQSVTSPIVFLPILSVDNKSYVLHVDSHLDTNIFQFKPVRYSFTANQSFMHLNFDFDVRRHSLQTASVWNEQELPINSFYSILLILLGLALFYHKQIQSYTQLLPFNFNKITSFFSIQSNKVNSDFLTKKKVKPKKN